MAPFHKNLAETAELKRGKGDGGPASKGRYRDESAAGSVTAVPKLR